MRQKGSRRRNRAPRPYDRPDQPQVRLHLSGLGQHDADIRGALGTIRHSDIAPRRGWWPRPRTLLAILGPVSSSWSRHNDAGAFSTYTQARQDYGTSLLWTLLLLVPVFYSSSPALYHHVIKYPIDRSLNPPGKYGQGFQV